MVVFLPGPYPYNTQPRQVSMKQHVMVVACLFGFATMLEVVVSPESATASLNGTATFRAKLRSAVLPVTYLWHHGGVPIDLATNPTVGQMRLVVSGITGVDAGEYSVLVTDQMGAVMSEPAQLSVDGTFRKVTEGVLVEDVEPSTGCIRGGCGWRWGSRCIRDEFGWSVSEQPV